MSNVVYAIMISNKQWKSGETVVTLPAIFNDFDKAVEYVGNLSGEDVWRICTFDTEFGFAIDYDITDLDDIYKRYSKVNSSEITDS